MTLQASQFLKGVLFTDTKDILDELCKVVTLINYIFVLFD